MRQRCGTIRWLAAAIPIVYVFALFSVTACGGGDDDDVGESSDDTPPDDIDVTDDDAVGGDDGVDDDGIPFGTPVLSSGYWNPPNIAWGPYCENPPTGDTACTEIVFSVCDSDGDLADPGGVWFYIAGTADPYFTTQPFPWSTLNTGKEDAANCDTPLEVAIGVLIPESSFDHGPGEYRTAIDIEATDATGNVSNTLENIVLTIIYEG
ncbi:MAG: hypothetical protein M5R36_08735 [Deltaproteobacteria bacterium]|nr:hypothetical protein [Deltaproteobacteria bacterium]